MYVCGMLVRACTHECEHIGYSLISRPSPFTCRFPRSSPGNEATSDAFAFVCTVCKGVRYICMHTRTCSAPPRVYRMLPHVTRPSPHLFFGACMWRGKAWERGEVWMIRNPAYIYVVCVLYVTTDSSLLPLLLWNFCFGHCTCMFKVHVPSNTSCIYTEFLHFL